MRAPAALIGCGVALLAPVGPRGGEGPGVAVANVDVSNAKGAQSEVAVAIDPRDPNVLLAGSNSAIERTMRAYGSANGGASWTSAAAPPLPPGSPRGSASADPAVGIDGASRQYFAFLRLAGRRSALFVARRSGPQGAWETPSEPVSAPPQSSIDDKPALAVDTSPASPHEGRLYVGWVRRSTFSIRILVSHSDDAGVTWSTPVAVNENDTFATYPSIAVARDGEVYVAWAELSRIAIGRSGDGGDRFGPDREVASVRPDAYPICAPIPAQPANCAQHNPVVSVDNSAGALGGHVYVTYADADRRGTRDVYAAAFDQALTPLLGYPLGGVAKRVNPADGSVRSDQFWPASAVDPATGRLWVCYYDTRGDRRRERAFFTCTASSDGGVTWARPVRAASVASNEAQPDANVRGYGDYEGLAVVGGVAHPIWTDSRKLQTLKEEIFTATLDGASLG